MYLSIYTDIYIYTQSKRDIKLKGWKRHRQILWKTSIISTVMGTNFLIIHKKSAVTHLAFYSHSEEDITRDVQT